jgi:extracellular factor (EF) 3-hydroxypalmitic acid methyl ester biosynthesis protein
MHTNDRALLSPSSTSVACVKFEATIEALAQSLINLKAESQGPAAVTDAEKLDLLVAHEPALREFERALAAFRDAGEVLPAEVQSGYHAYTHQRVHPQMLQSPFARRCFEKPLGYAGDYVTVRYIVGDPLQGDTAFAQLMNYALQQADVAQGHRNRIKVLEALLSEHAATAHAEGRKARGMTIGCGPAEETFRFIMNSPHADSLDLTLVDFNRETLDWTADRLKQACAQTGRNPGLEFVQESVVNIARRREDTIRQEFDFVVCAGLFDYFSDKVCSRVIQFGARSLLPGGALVVTNVSKCGSSFGMSKLLEWNLIYRSAEQLDSLMPRWPGLSHKVYVDETGTNVVAEMRREAQVLQAAA